jgi:cardiolipin synthase
VSDVSIMQEAARALYGAFQRRGAQVYEYRPQVLHAKTVVADDTVYVGSANLDPRSLAINFEIMLRIRSPELAARAVATFERDLEHSDLAPRQSWRRPAGWWRKLKQRIALFIFTRLDPLVAQALSHRSEHRGAVEPRESGGGQK